MIVRLLERLLYQPRPHFFFFFFYLTGYLYRSVPLYLSCPNLCFSPPSSSPLLLEAQMLFRSPEGRVELRLSHCWSHTTVRDRLFTAVMPAMPCHVTTLSTLERTLIIWWSHRRKNLTITPFMSGCGEIKAAVWNITQHTSWRVIHFCVNRYEQTATIFAVWIQFFMEGWQALVINLINNE